MQNGNHKIFLSKEKLYLLVNYRLNGFSISTLSNIFQCDTSSIRYQLDKYDIKPPEEVYTIERIITPVINWLVPRDNWEQIGSERINNGSSYREYLKRAHIPLQKYYY